MSDKLNRGSRDFSIYDVMATEELEEILRLDVEAPEGEESDTELILYVMEVLADRRRNSKDFTGKTTQQAFESFIHNYIPDEDEIKNSQKAIERSEKKHKPILWLRKLTAVAAVLVIVLFGTITAKAFGVDVWNIVAMWAQETFRFSNEGYPKSDNPIISNQLPYASLQEALNSNFSNPVQMPTWIPNGYELLDINIHESPLQKKYVATYVSGEKYLKIFVQIHSGQNPEQLEQSEGFFEIYEVEGIEYYLFSNIQVAKAAWINGSYECYISGEVTIEELKAMIDSIQKG